MTGRILLLRRRAVVFCLIGTLSCGDDTGDVTTPVDPPVPTTLSIAPDSVMFTALGDTVRLAVEVRDQNGQAMSGAPVSWTSTDPSVASVTASGLVRAVAQGSATITARAGAASGTAGVAVRQEIAGVAVSPDSVVFRALGDTARLAAAVSDRNGHAISEVPVNWTSTDSSVASVTDSGLVRAVAEGTATITASSGTLSDSVGVAVYQEVAGVVVFPATAALVVGDTLRLTAETQDDNGNPVEWTEFIWLSGNEHVATVDSAGLVQARVRGDATITAQVRAITGYAELTVRLPLIPPNFAVDEGTSHALQFAGIYVSHRQLRQNPFEYDYPAANAYLDFNGDGRIDIFHSASDGSTDPVPAQVYLNNGMGGFDIAPAFFGEDPPGGVAPRKALTGDFNGDGKPDVFVVDQGYDYPPFPGASSYAVLSSDSGYVNAEGLDEIIGFQHGGASADIDADGDLDVVVTNGYGFDAPFVFVNDGAGNFVWDTTRIEGITQAIYTAELVDVDRDG